MSEIKVFRLTVHPEKVMAPHGISMPVPTIQVLYDGQTEYTTFSDHIEGFDAVDGHKYVIEVESRPRPPPLPMDVSSILYRLVKIISDEVV